MRRNRGDSMCWSSMPSKDGQLSAEELTKPEGDFQSGSKEAVQGENTDEI